MSNRSQRRYVKEPFSCYSHLFGAVLAIPGLVLLVAHAGGEPWRTVGFSIYGTTLLLLYSASSLYHGLPLSPRMEDRLRRWDHIAIYLLIAGTYTPICLVSLRGAWGWSLFVLVWGFAAVGTALKIGRAHHPRWVTTVLYLAMGWMAVIAIAPLLRTFTPEALSWIAAGGLFYTVGAVIYGVQRPDPIPNVFGFHEIFHIFVLAGSAAHFVFMIRYVAPTM